MPRKKVVDKLNSDNVEFIQCDLSEKKKFLNFQKN